MANYSTYIVRIVKNEAFEISFLNDLCQEIANATVELEPPLLYHVEEDGFAVDIRYTCRRSGYDFDSLIIDNDILFAQIICDSGGAKDNVMFQEKVQSKNVLSYSGCEAAYEFDKLIIFGQSSITDYLFRFNDLLIQTDSSLDKNVLEVNTIGYYACSSYHELRGDYKNQRTKRVSRKEFLALYKSQSLETVYLSNEDIETVYLECFTNGRHSESLISEISKIQFLFKNRIVHEIRERRTYPNYFTSNYWDNIMVKNELRNKYFR